MRSLTIFVNAALVLTGSVNLVLAQHGGGHSSGGHSMSGSSHAHSSSPASSHNVYPTLPANIGLQSQPSGYTGINPGALPLRNYGNGVGYGVSRYPNRRPNRYRSYGYYPYFPIFGYDDGFFDNGSYTGYQYQQAPVESTGSVSDNLLSDQVNQLSAEVDALRNEREQGNMAPGPRPRYNAPPMMMPEDDTASSAPITLILNDGKKVQMKSYAVMGNQVWDFSSQPAHKIPLANVNIAASQKATEADGGEFPDLH